MSKHTIPANIIIFSSKNGQKTLLFDVVKFYSKQVLTHLDSEYLTEEMGFSATISAKINLF